MSNLAVQNQAPLRAAADRIPASSQFCEGLEEVAHEAGQIRASEPEVLLDFRTPIMRDSMDVLFQAARTSASILITGESGTGKSIAARAVHRSSHLADRPFVTVSCASLSKELLESELFGHTKGAFTGAIRDHWGKVKAVAGGTLFLDEVGDLPLEIQPKLLRLLQEREYERVGENQTRHADMRVIAATNRNLKRRMSEGAFREDLYFRLNVIAVEMPPLRERPRDVLHFAEHYLSHFAAQSGRTLAGFSHEAQACILAYSWPGNLRELRNTVERAVVLSKGGQVFPENLPADVRCARSTGTTEAENPTLVGSLVSIKKLEEIHIRRVLQKSPSLKDASKILGIDRVTLYRMRKKIGIDKLLKAGSNLPAHTRLRAV